MINQDLLLAGTIARCRAMIQVRIRLPIRIRLDPLQYLFQFRDFKIVQSR